VGPDRGFRLTATMAGRDQIAVEAGDAFSALLQLRRLLEDAGVLIRCAGARRDVWASGMQRDMGEGLRAYVLSLPRRAERPPSVDILEPTPAELAASVAEQEQFVKQWQQSPLAP